jgi:hypothetical protein
MDYLSPTAESQHSADKKSPVPFTHLHCHIIVTIFIVLIIITIQTTCTALYTWHDFIISSKKYMSSDITQIHAKYRVQYIVILINSMKTVIIMQQCNRKCVKGTGDFLSALC